MLRVLLPCVGKLENCCLILVPGAECFPKLFPCFFSAYMWSAPYRVFVPFCTRNFYYNIRRIYAQCIFEFRSEICECIISYKANKKSSDGFQYCTMCWIQLRKRLAFVNFTGPMEKLSIASIKIHCTSIIPQVFRVFHFLSVSKLHIHAFRFRENSLISRLSSSKR